MTSFAEEGVEARACEGVRGDTVGRGIRCFEGVAVPVDATLGGISVSAFGDGEGRFWGTTAAGKCRALA